MVVTVSTARRYVISRCRSRFRCALPARQQEVLSLKQIAKLRVIEAGQAAQHGAHLASACVLFSQVGTVARTSPNGPLQSDDCGFSIAHFVSVQQQSPCSSGRNRIFDSTRIATTITVQEPGLRRQFQNLAILSPVPQSDNACGFLLSTLQLYWLAALERSTVPVLGKP
ncbi:hypothetical protein [Bradyrhizobium japonicum]|uniref:hypothetical protein n=1 Tax=Bradyrhizobium japonicum TaxID=375 RepID=UPI0027146581|nr:hypothetical protein [Bradyrhizobium japonicum]WLB24365.1 hypothetical protein QIH95_48455 [Bradyrhizobium japonicum]